MCRHAQYAAWADAKHIYLAVEYANAGDVYKLLKKRTKFPEASAVTQILAPFLSALAYIHSKVRA